MFSRVDPNVFLENEDMINKTIINTFVTPLNKETSNKFEPSLKAFFTIYNRYHSAIFKSEILKSKDTYKVFKEN